MDMKPDVVFVAAGSRNAIPEFPGSDRFNVVSGTEVYAGRQNVGQKIVIAGGGRLGCEVGIQLAKQGKQVTIVEILEDIASDVEPLSQMTLRQMLAEHGVQVITRHKLVSVTDEGAVIMDRDWNETVLPTDNVVIAMGAHT